MMTDKIPSFEDYMLPLMELLSDGREHTLAESIERLCKGFQLSREQQRALLPSGRQPIVNNRIGWARTYLTKAGLIESTGRALFKITNRGADVLKGAPERIDVAFLERFPEFMRFRNASKSNVTHSSRRGSSEVSISINEGRATVIVDAKKLPDILAVLGI